MWFPPTRILLFPALPHQNTAWEVRAEGKTTPLMGIVQRKENMWYDRISRHSFFVTDCMNEFWQTPKGSNIPPLF